MGSPLGFLQLTAVDQECQIFTVFFVGFIVMELKTLNYLFKKKKVPPKLALAEHFDLSANVLCVCRKTGSSLKQLLRHHSGRKDQWQQSAGSREER